VLYSCLQLLNTGNIKHEWRSVLFACMSIMYPLNFGICRVMVRPNMFKHVKEKLLDKRSLTEDEKHANGNEKINNLM